MKNMVKKLIKWYFNINAQFYENTDMNFYKFS